MSRDPISLDLIPAEQWWVATEAGIELTSRIYLQDIQEDERGYYIALRDLRGRDVLLLLKQAGREHKEQQAERAIERAESHRNLLKDTD